MKINKRAKNRSSTELGERNLLIRARIINSFNLNEEVFLKKYFCDRETLFMVCLPSFKKLLREKPDIKFISLYLSNLKKFITLLKSINEDNNNNNNTAKQNINEKDKYLRLLRYVSEHIIYEKYASKRLVMRYGDIGDKFYIILHGLVSIIIPIRVNMQLTFNEYSRYIARLILYQEYELAKITMRENKHIYNIDLPDIKFIIYYIHRNKDDDDDDYLRNEDKFSRNYYSSVKNIKSTKNVLKQKLGNKVSKYILTKVDEEENRNFEIEKMIEGENSIKIENFLKKYLTKEEYEEIKRNDIYLETNEEDKIITPEIYISRLKNFKMNTTNEQIIRKKRSNSFYHSAPSRKSSKNIGFLNKEKEKEKEETENFENLQAKHNKNTVYIYEYQEIIQLETGNMFGDAALSSSSSKRTATIISVVDSYFGCLNKEIYNAIKGSNEKNKKNMINYLCHTRIFKSINYKTLEDKYLNYFAFKNAVMDEYIIKNGDINSNLIIIKSGTFEISFTGNLEDIFNILNYYIENFSDLDEKKYELKDTLFRKIYKLNDNRRKIEKLFGDDKNINNENKLFLINSSSIFGLKETERKNGKNEYLSFYDIKCTSSEGEYVLLDKRIFYRQIYGTDFKVKEETKYYIKEFAEKAINRLVHVLYGKIWTILTKNDMKFFRNIKKFSNSGNKNKNKNNNLMFEIGLDLKYMNKFDLTDIEWIIEKILNKYNEDAFDNRNLSAYLYNYFENEKITSIQEKNMIKIEEEKYDSNKFRNFFKHLKVKNKKLYNKLLNNKRHNSIFNKHIKNINNEKITKLLSNTNYKNINERRNIFTPNNPRRTKYKLDKSFSSCVEEKKNDVSPKNNKNYFFFKNYYNNNKKNKNNINNISKNISSGLSQGKTMDSFISDVSVNCNYANFNNACISKLNYKIKKNNSMNDFETANNNNFIKSKYNNLIECKMNHLFGGNEKYKSIYNRCFSARHNNNSKINIFDSNQISKEIYVDQRKDYILKNTRALFTRNKNFVQYKRSKKKVDKNV